MTTERRPGHPRTAPQFDVVAIGAGGVAVARELTTTYGFDFRQYKEPSLARRIGVRMGQLHLDDFEVYMRRC